MKLAQLRNFQAQDPENFPLALDLADELLRQGELVEAGGVISKLLALHGPSDIVLWRQARLALLNGEFDDAIQWLSSILQRQDLPAIRHDLAFAHLALGQPAPAEQALAEALPQASSMPKIGLLQARILQYQNRYAEAIALLESVLRQHPELAEAWGLLALSQLDALMITAAGATVERALQLDPQQADALTTLGTLALWHRDADAANQAFKTVLDRQPQAGRALSGAGQAALLVGDIGVARRRLSLAVNAMPTHLGSWHALAWCDLLEGRLDAASDAFERALELDRNFGETHGGLALAQVLKGHANEAERTLRKAFRLDPQGRNARYAQSLLWSVQGREDEAASLVGDILAEAGVASAMPTLAFIAQLRDRLTPASRH